MSKFSTSVVSVSGSRVPLVGRDFPAYHAALEDHEFDLPAYFSTELIALSACIQAGYNSSNGIHIHRAK